MASLSDLTQIIKKTAPVALLILIIILLLSLLFIKYRRPEAPPVGQISPPPQPKIYQNPVQKQVTSYDFSQSPRITVPQQLPTYQLDFFDLTDAATQTLASSLDITSGPNSVDETIEGKQYIFKQKDYTLTINRNSLRYSLNNPSGVSLSALNEPDLLVKASTFTKKIPVTDETIVAETSKTKYLTIAGDRYRSAPSFANAQIVEFYFEKKLATYPLIQNNPTTPLVSVRTKKDGQIIYLNLQLQNKFNKSNQFPLISFDEAVKRIRIGQGKIVYNAILDENGQALELFRVQPVAISQAKITNIFLAYLLPENSQETIQPIFVFEGSYPHEDGQGKVVIYLPAIKTSASPKP